MVGLKRLGFAVGSIWFLTFFLLIAVGCRDEECPVTPDLGDGKNWRSLGFEEEWILSVASDPRDANIIFLAGVDDWITHFGNSVIHRSFDGGYSWDTLYVPGNRRLYSIEFADDGQGTLYAAGQTYPDPVLVSIDSALTFEAVNTDGVEYAVMYGFMVRPHPYHPERLFISMGYLSQDLTAWREGPDSPWQEFMNRYLVEKLAFSGPQGRWITAIPPGGDIHQFSLDDGQTWSGITNPHEPYGVFDMVVDPLDSTRLLLGTRDGLQVSLDQGMTWTILPGQPSEGQVHSIEVFGTTIYAAFQFTEPRFGTYERVYALKGEEWVELGNLQFARYTPTNPSTDYKLKADTHGRLYRYDAGAYVYE